jgi:hypothetical protein
MKEYEKIHYHFEITFLHYGRYWGHNTKVTDGQRRVSSTYIKSI